LLSIYHIPVCPFSQRLEILLSLKGRQKLAEFKLIDITKPRPQWLLDKTQGTTALPVLETEDGSILKESLVIQQYIEDITPDKPVAQADPLQRAIENMLVTLAGPFADAGYSMVLNQDPKHAPEYEKKLLEIYRRINNFLELYATSDEWLFDEFGWAEVVFTPLFMRFWFLEYYDDFSLPVGNEFARVARWQSACTQHPDAQQVTREEIIKLYYDYAQGAGNGRLLPGRTVSSFSFNPPWQSRPWPDKKKYSTKQSDKQLGLI